MLYNVITALILICVFATGYMAGEGKQRREERRQLKKKWENRPRATR